MLLLSSCDLFKVRESEPPGEPPPWNDHTYELAQALQNLGYCYTDSRNKIHYAGLFTDNYVFHFAPQDISDFSIEPTWNRNQEQDMIQLFHNRYMHIEMDSLLINADDQLGENEAQFYSSYTIRGVSRRGETRSIILANGNMELHFRRISGYWYIEHWYDYRSASGSTWGKLKHENS
jgi:hypothetical protein